jgi:Ca-activated chloride channel homolog
MLNRRRMTGILLGAAGISALPASSQQKPPAENAEQPIRVDVERVALLFAVTDRKGRFVTDLKKEDFQVVDNRRYQPIMEFSAESEMPLRLAILVDTSNSVRDRFRFQQEAAMEFIKNVLRPKQDQAAVISFDTASELVSDLTNNLDKLEKAIRSLRPGGGTALYDAVFFAARDKMGEASGTRSRNVMVIVGDGDDNQSRYSRDQALEMAQKADAIIYTISTNITRIESEGDRVLKYLAAETGGLSFFPFKPTDLTQSFENISNELRHQYSLLYRPDPFPHDGLFHPVELRIKLKKGLLVRARRGYFAPKR